MDDPVLQSHPAPGVALLALNRPQARNALSLELRQALERHLRDLAQDAAVGAVVIAGSERVFAAGADLRAIAQAGALEMMDSGLHHLWQTMARYPKPLVMAVRGPALGAGCELAMHGDLIIAAEDALFGQPEIKVGTIPGAGGIQRLIRLVGRTRALRLLLTGKPISGRVAHEWGLASDACPAEEVLDRAIGYAATIAGMPRGAAQSIKELVRLGADLPLEAAAALDRQSFWLTFGSADQREGMAAFLEKRQPAFNGASAEPPAPGESGVKTG